jgi:hypothetical protein
MDERTSVSDAERVAEQLCQVRPGEPCRLCVPGATGPQDCGLVYLVMTDLDLRTELARMQADDPPVRRGRDVRVR